MPAIRHDQLLLRLLRDVNDIRSALRRVTVNLPLFDIANENTPDQFSGDQDNYVPGNYDVLRIASDQAGRSITGFRGGIKGRFLRLLNIGDYEIILAHQSASSDAENRIISPTEFDIILNAGGEILLYYDFSRSRWISSYSSNSDRISCELRLSVAQSIPDASRTPISWSNIVTDTGDFFDSGSPTYVTIPETGWYHVYVQASWDGYGPGGDNQRELGLGKNDPGGTSGVLGFDSRVARTVAISHNISRPVYLQKDDTIHAAVWQNTGGALNLAVNASASIGTTLIVLKM